MRFMLTPALLVLVACGGSPAEAPPEAPPAAEAHATPAAAAPNPAHGAEIVGQKCTACHTDEVYTRADHKVTSPEALQAQVEMCGGAAQLSAADKADVQAYLQSEVYDFE